MNAEKVVCLSVCLPARLILSRRSRRGFTTTELLTLNMGSSKKSLEEGNEDRKDREQEGRKEGQKQGQKMAPLHFSLGQIVLLCIVMLALEMFISFEEIFMLVLLQRVGVPTAFVSLPGIISSVVGVLVIPFLGWTSDRFTCSTCCGQKRPYAVLTLALCVLGVSILIGVNVVSLYGHPENVINSTRQRINSSSGMDRNSEPAGFSCLSPLGLLGILSFALTEHGYDSSILTFKAYTMAVTPSSQHDDIFVLATLVGAIGGCISSLLGFVDLTFVFPRGPGVLDRGVAQCLAQAAIVWVALVVLGSCSLFTGSENRRLEHARSSFSTYESTADPDREIHDTSPQNGYQSLNGNVIDSTRNSQQNTSQQYLFGSKTKATRLWKKRLFLCVMTFLGLCTNYAYFIYVTNYVAEVIYNGDPGGEPGSDEYENYVEGVHVASLGMLVFYCLFVAFSLIQKKILNKIGLRAEYLGASVGCSVILLILALTDNIVVFFASSVALSVFRSAVYTIPFMLSNNYAKQEAVEAKDESELGHSNSYSGVAMAFVTVMIPASYFLVSLVMGPLMDVTGYSGSPIYFASASCFLGILSSCFVLFEETPAAET